MVLFVTDGRITSGTEHVIGCAKRLEKKICNYGLISLFIYICIYEKGYEVNKINISKNNTRRL